MTQHSHLLFVIRATKIMDDPTYIVQKHKDTLTIKQITERNGIRAPLSKGIEMDLKQH